jgi:protein-S-isoprenylcysteine O-methyltransferase Ste14
LEWRSPFGLAIAACWLAFVAVFGVGALTASRAKRVESLSSRAVHMSLSALGALLLTPWGAAIPGNSPLAAPSLWRSLGAVTATALGVAFTLWARISLRRHWSGRVTLKEGHELIQSGPYRLARHPIYTGITTALVGVALLEGRPGGIVAVGCFLGAFLWKIRAEERLMTEAFGDGYRAYKHRVKALIPFIL